jgi:CheY-like chemotaxis protein
VSQEERPDASPEALIVDDDHASAKLMAVILRARGWTASVVPDAEAALALLDRTQPRLVVIDLILPRMSGLVLAQTIKANPATRDVVLIAVSSFNGPTTRRMVLEAGCAAYMAKPIDRPAFVKLLDQHLGG